MTSKAQRAALALSTSGSASDSAAANTGSVVNVGDDAPGYSEGGR